MYFNNKKKSVYVILHCKLMVDFNNIYCHNLNYKISVQLIELGLV